MEIPPRAATRRRLKNLDRWLRLRGNPSVVTYIYELALVKQRWRIAAVCCLLRHSLRLTPSNAPSRHLSARRRRGARSSTRHSVFMASKQQGAHASCCRIPAALLLAFHWRSAAFSGPAFAGLIGRAVMAASLLVAYSAFLESSRQPVMLKIGKSCLPWP
jgi:hypothetical protein